MPHGALWAIALIGLLATSFALLGGMHAVIWTDVMQFFVLDHRTDRHDCDGPAFERRAQRT